MMRATGRAPAFHAFYYYSHSKDVDARDKGRGRRR